MKWYKVAQVASHSAVWQHAYRRNYPQGQDRHRQHRCNINQWSDRKAFSA